MTSSHPFAALSVAGIMKLYSDPHRPSLPITPTASPRPQAATDCLSSMRSQAALANDPLGKPSWHVSLPRSIIPRKTRHADQTSDLDRLESPSDFDELEWGPAPLTLVNEA